MQCGPKCAAPACPAMSNARWRESGTDCRYWRDASREAVARMKPTGRANARPMTGSAQSGTALAGCDRVPGYAALHPGLRWLRYAVTASARSSSSISSSIGLKVESGLVESVIGLRPPWDDDEAERAAG